MSLLKYIVQKQKQETEWGDAILLQCLTWALRREEARIQKLVMASPSCSTMKDLHQRIQEERW